MVFNHNAKESLEQRQYMPLPKILEFIAAGLSGAVYGIDHETVVKIFFDRIDGDVERQAYERLGSHPHIAKYLGTGENGCIFIERGCVLRTQCRSTKTGQIPLQRKLRWLRHAANGIRHIHENQILHGDIGTHNMILTNNDLLKIIDLAGASIDGGEAISCYEWFSYRRSVPQVSKQTDIFAFGCVAYEIITGKPPYHEFESRENRAILVEHMYQESQFPNVTDLPLGEMMLKCWQSTFNSMNEIIQVLEAACAGESVHPNATFSNTSLLSATSIGAEATCILASSPIERTFLYVADRLGGLADTASLASSRQSTHLAGQFRNVSSTEASCLSLKARFRAGLTKFLQSSCCFN